MTSDTGTQPLGNFVTLISGNTPSKSNPIYWGGTTPWISAKDMVDFWIDDSKDHLTSEGVKVASRLIPAGSVLLLTRGMTLHKRVPICRTKKPATFNQDVKAVLPKAGLSTRFLPYLLTGNHDRLHQKVDSAGHGTGRLNTDALLSFPVWLPDLSEQEAIADIGEALDERIKLLRETNATLEAIAQAIFKSWFVDFDPVRAKMEGRAPEGMDEETAALFPDGFEESELGLVPRGWAIHTMSDVSTVGIGKTPPRKEPEWFSDNSADIRWVSIRDMGAVGVFASQTNEFLTREGVEKFKVRMVPHNTVLMSFKMTIGRVAITDGEMTTNEAIAHFKLNPASPLSTEYIYLHLKQFDFSTLSSTSSIADAVNSKSVREIPILMPSRPVLAAFQSQVETVFQQLKNYERLAQTLASLRDVLLPRLVSGRVTLESPCEASNA